MKTSRTYEMRARADQVAQTRQRIIAATIAVSAERPILAVSLPDIAARAGVSVQTVLRQFGSREGLFDAVERDVQGEVLAERETVPGDIDRAVETIMAHYELRGDGVLVFLGQESWEPRAARITSFGRGLHRDWVEATFAPFLPVDSDEREALTDLLVVATDVYTWKLLRRDRGRSVEETAQRMRRMITALLKRG